MEEDKRTGKLKIVLIRHFATDGNQYKKYIGITDESVSEAGISQAVGRNYPKVDAVFSSPMKRCLETAEIIYPNQIPLMEQKMAECNFGEFENKNYIELSENPNYIEWIQSNGRMTFPGGENPMEFRRRSIEGFLNMVEISFHHDFHQVAAIVHGGTIMSILEKYAGTSDEFYHWKVENGEGYQFEMEYSKGRVIHICDLRLLH